MTNFSIYWRKALQYHSALSEPRDETGFQWPRRVNGVRVEPASGVVRILPDGAQPIELATPEIRLLAEHAASRRQRVLLDAADEADRQRDALVQVLEADV